MIAGKNEVSYVGVVSIIILCMTHGISEFQN